MLRVTEHGTAYDRHVLARIDMLCTDLHVAQIPEAEYAVPLKAKLAKNPTRLNSQMSLQAAHTFDWTEEDDEVALAGHCGGFQCPKKARLSNRCAGY